MFVYVRECVMCACVREGEGEGEGEGEMRMCVCACVSCAYCVEVLPGPLSAINLLF